MQKIKEMFVPKSTYRGSKAIMHINKTFDEGRK